MWYFTLQEVWNPMQIIKNVELSRFQAILQTQSLLFESLFSRLKRFICNFLQIQTCDKMRALFIFQNIDYASNID